MKDLIDAITAATAADATSEQKATGAAACRTILAALDTPAGAPLPMVSAPPRASGPRLSLDQILDLAIAKLSSVAASRETDSATAPADEHTPRPTTHGMRIPMVPHAALRGASSSSAAGLKPTDKGSRATGTLRGPKPRPIPMPRRARTA